MPAESKPDRLFVAGMVTGLHYTDTTRERHGDYLLLARLPYSTLVLEWQGHPMPEDLRQRINDHAAQHVAARGRLT